MRQQNIQDEHFIPKFEQGMHTEVSIGESSSVVMTISGSSSTSNADVEVVGELSSKALLMRAFMSAINSASNSSIALRQISQLSACHVVSL
jgi:hypothetical protein